MRKVVLFRDKVGNTLSFEGNKLAVRNREGKLVRKKDAEWFIKKIGMKTKMVKKKLYGRLPIKKLW